MNNCEREIDQLFTEMEKEVANLKTAHQRPLGALNFFTKNQSFTVNLSLMAGSYIATFNIIVKITTPTATPPIVQSGWDTPANFYRVERLEFGTNMDYDTYTYKLRLSTTSTVPSTTLKVYALSSQPIESITLEYV